MLSGMDSSSSSSSAGAVRMADMFQKMKHQAHDVDGETATTTTTKTTTTTTSTASSSNDDSHLLVLNRDLKRYELLLEL